MSPWWISASSETSRVAPPRSGIGNVPVRGPLSEVVSGSVTGWDPTYTRYSAPADISVMVYVTASPGCTGLLGPLGPQPTMLGPVHAQADPVASARAETTLHLTRATRFITLPFACAPQKKSASGGGLPPDAAMSSRLSALGAARGPRRLDGNPLATRDRTQTRCRLRHESAVKRRLRRLRPETEVAAGIGADTGELAVAGRPRRA